MNTRREEISPETLAIIEKLAKSLDLPVDDYLRSLLPGGQRELALKGDDSEDFEADMMAFAEDLETIPPYDGTYSRDDIYFDHD